MPLAKEVAAELRKLADTLDASSDTSVSVARINLHSYDEEAFRNIVRLLPKPLKKKFSGGFVEVIYGGLDCPIQITCSMLQERLSFRLIRPAQEAVYEHAPILSEAEDAELFGG